MSGVLTDRSYPGAYDWTMDEAQVKFDEYESEPCRGGDSYSAGDEVLMRDGGDAIVGKTNLELGQPAMGVDTNSRVDEVPWYVGGVRKTKLVTVNSVSTAVRSCSMSFTLEVQPADFYTIYIDGVMGPTWTVAELEQLDWSVLLGDEPVPSGVFGEGAYNATTTTTTSASTTTTSVAAAASTTTSLVPVAPTTTSSTTTTSASTTGEPEVLIESGVVDVSGSTVRCSADGIHIQYVVMNLSDETIQIEQVNLVPDAVAGGHAFFDAFDWIPLPVLSPDESASYDDFYDIPWRSAGDKVEVYASWTTTDKWGYDTALVTCE